MSAGIFRLGSGDGIDGLDELEEAAAGVGSTTRVAIAPQALASAAIAEQRKKQILTLLVLGGAAFAIWWFFIRNKKLGEASAEPRKNQSRSPRHKPRVKKWIQSAVKHPGKYRASVERRYGAKGFTKRGTIKPAIIEHDIEEGAPAVRKMANLAKTLKGRR